MEQPLDPDAMVNPAAQELLGAVFHLNELALTGLSGWSALAEQQGFLSASQAYQRDILLAMRELVQDLGQYVSSLNQVEAPAGTAVLLGQVDERRLHVKVGSVQDDALRMVEIFLSSWGSAPR